MSRTIYLNGEFMAEDQAKISIFDRGLLFSDAVYEGLGVLDGQIIDFTHHMTRLRRSLGELKISEPMEQDELFGFLMQLVRLNGVDEGFMYLHITRGVEDRDYLYGDALKPTIFAFTQPQHYGRADDVVRAISMQSTPDLRWARRDIKTSNLLGQVLAKQAAREAGADEAVMIDGDGNVTEGGSTSFFIVKGGTLYIRPLSNEILGSITRKTMLRVAGELDVETSERLFTLEDVFLADEAFQTGASSYVEPVGQVDGNAIGNGQPGAFTLKLRAAYLKAVRSTFYTPPKA
ncbi:MAG: D-alanine transaminase [Paracoccaceae bacterium]|jgi:D-alanine transaminase